MNEINNDTALAEVPAELVLDGAAPPAEASSGDGRGPRQHHSTVIPAVLRTARDAGLLAPGELVAAWQAVGRLSREHAVLLTCPNLDSLINFEAGKLAEDAADPDAWGDGLTDDDHRLLWEGTAREVEITKAAMAVVLRAWRALATDAVQVYDATRAPWWRYLVEQHRAVLDTVTALPDWHALAKATDVTHFTAGARQKADQVAELLDRYDAVHRLAGALRGRWHDGRYLYSQTARHPGELAERAAMHPADRLAYDLTGGAWLPDHEDLQAAAAESRAADDDPQAAALAAALTAERNERDTAVNYGHWRG